VEGETIALSADATDETAVASVLFTANGMAQPIDNTGPFSVNFTVPTGIASLTVQATATDNAGKQGFATRNVSVIPDPLTVIVGQVLGTDGLPAVGATVKVYGTLTATTGTDGTFIIENAPTIFGNIVASVSHTANGLPQFGASGFVPPVRGGITVLGEIHLIPGFPNGNGGFETGDFTGYIVSGQRSVVRNLGSLLPPEGEFMAYITTGGIAVEGATSTIRTEPFLIPSGVKFLVFDYNFLTLDYPPFEDFLQVRITTPEGQTVHRVAQMSDAQIPANHVGYSFMTGFLEFRVDVSNVGLGTVDFEMSVSDVLDTSVDSAALIDNLRFEAAVTEE
jgi:hypothetical protein